jgi:hypothetical protein
MVRGPFKKGGGREHSGPHISSYFAPKRTNDQVDPETPSIVEPLNKRCLQETESHEEDAKDKIGAPMDPSNVKAPSPAAGKDKSHSFTTIGAPMDPSSVTTPLDEDEQHAPCPDDESSDEEILIEDESSDEEFLIEDESSDDEFALHQELVADNVSRQADGQCPGPSTSALDQELGLTEVIVSSPMATRMKGTIALKVLRATIETLKAQAGAMDPNPLEEDRLMMRTFARLLREDTTDELVDLYSESFTPELIALFERKAWTLEGLKSLPLAENDGKVGIYLIIASSMDSLEAGYIGSASSRGGIRSRNMQHKSAINSKPRPDDLLYSFVQGSGIQTDHRTLLHFSPEPKHRAYILLAEALGTLWLGTLEEPKKNGLFYNRNSFEMVRNIRIVLENDGLAPLPLWKPLNRAWQLLQGYPKPPYVPLKDRVCSNPHCRVPYSDENPIGFIRGRSEWPEEIRGRLICERCYQFNMRNPERLRVPRATNLQCAYSGCKNPDNPDRKGQWYICKPEWDKDAAGKRICKACYFRFYQRAGPMQCANPDCKSTVVRQVLTCKSEWSEDLAGQKICKTCYNRFKQYNDSLECANPDCLTKVVRQVLICKTEWSEDLAGQKICVACYARFKRRASVLTDKDPNISTPKRETPEHTNALPDNGQRCANPECKVTVVRQLLTCQPEWSEDLAGQKICRSCYDRFKKRAAPQLGMECANPDCPAEVVLKLLTCKAEWSEDLAGQKICGVCYDRFRRRANALFPKDPNLPGPKAKKK